VPRQYGFFKVNSKSIEMTFLSLTSHVSTVRAWTGVEFKGVADRVADVAKACRPPGKKMFGCGTNRCLTMVGQRHQRARFSEGFRLNKNCPPGAVAARRWGERAQVALATDEASADGRLELKTP
jgi:hypothetical protein